MSFTRIPNKIIDELKLNPFQFQLLSIIVRKTDGWCNIEDGISLSQFEKLVTFKRPKIVSTLKDLENMLLIVKTKQQKDNGGNSFNLYKIHTTLVTENNYPSNPQLLPLVTEDYIQKKLTTKETKTKPYDSFLEQVKEQVSIKSKVTKTKEGKELFNKIENKELLLKSYVNHQLEKKEFSQRITAYMMDYKPTKNEKTIGGYTY